MDHFINSKSDKILRRENFRLGMASTFWNFVTCDQTTNFDWESFSPIKYFLENVALIKSNAKMKLKLCAKNIPPNYHKILRNFS